MGPGDSPMSGRVERPPARLLVVGATGAVGREVLRLGLDHTRKPHLVALTRRPIREAGRLTSVVVDFDRLDDDAPWWRVDGVVCALGTTMRAAGSRDAFAAVDRDLPILVARNARRAGATAFALTSSVGAGTGGSFYLRTKAEAEHGVGRVGFPSLTIVRPSLLDAGRSESRPGERLALLAARVLGPLVPRRYRPVTPAAVARALLDGVLEPSGGVRIVESEEL